MIPDSLLTALSTMAKSFGRNFKTLGDKIDALADKIGERNAQNNRLIADAINGLKAAVSNPTVTAVVDFDDSKLMQGFEKIATLTAANKPERTDLTDLAAGIKILATKMDDQTKQFGQFFNDATTRLDAVNSSVKLIKPKDTFKLDDMQLRALATSSSGGTPGGAMAPRTHNIRVVSLTDANTQYSITLSANCVGYFIHNRSLNVQLLVASATGKLPTSGDGLAYMTIPQNGYLSPMGLDVGGNTLYLQTASATQTAEVIEYIA